MLNKGRIISNALLFLGEVREYNNNNYEIYRTSEHLFSSIQEKISSSPIFMANATKAKLTLYAVRDDEYVYNRPIDMLSIVSASGYYQIIGEYIHSDTQDLEIIYCRKIDLAEYPSYYEDLFVLSLCKKLSEAYSQYETKLPYILQKLQEEEFNISKIEVQKHRSYIE